MIQLWYSPFIGEINEAPEINPDDAEAEKAPTGIELILSQVDRVSELVQKDFESDEPFSLEEEAEFQAYLREWVEEYQGLVAAGESSSAEALNVLDTIRTMFGNYPIDLELLPGDAYAPLSPEGGKPTEEG